MKNSKYAWFGHMTRS